MNMMKSASLLLIVFLLGCSYHEKEEFFLKFEDINGDIYDVFINNKFIGKFNSKINLCAYSICPISIRHQPGIDNNDKLWVYQIGMETHENTEDILLPIKIKHEGVILDFQVLSTAFNPKNKTMTIIIKAQSETF